jgi:hypothetical protein
MTFRERWRYQPFATNPAPRLLWMARVLWGAVGVLGSWCGEADVRIRSSGHVHPGCSAAGSPPTPISSRRWIRPGQFWRAAQVRLVQHLTSSVVGTSGPCSRRDASTTGSDPLNYQNTPSRRASNRTTSAGEPGGRLATRREYLPPHRDRLGVQFLVAARRVLFILRSDGYGVRLLLEVGTERWC